MRRFLVTLVAVATLSGPMLAVTGAVPAAPVEAQQSGLVNVEFTDVDLLSHNRVGVNVGVAAQLIAQVCGIDVDVAAILAQINDTGAFTTACGAEQGDVTVTQANNPGGGGSPKKP